MEVLSHIQNSGKAVLSVPQLSNLLGVKTTTLNARFRRQGLSVQTVGRVNFISIDLALKLAGLHKYALMGWLTIQQASRLTGVKGCTIKARCEKGQVEGYIDLTKRLRINPAALSSLNEPRRTDPPAVNDLSGAVPRSKRMDPPARMPVTSPPSRVQVKSPPQFAGRAVCHPANPQLPARNRPAGARYVLPPPKDPEVRIINSKTYGIPDWKPAPRPPTRSAPSAPRIPAGYLSYDPDAPLSLSDCAIGRPILYGEYKGTILSILDEPFSPKIRVSFPDHQHPLMREVLLVVQKRKD
jgi:hypothetical protein